MKKQEMKHKNRGIKELNTSYGSSIPDSDILIKSDGSEKL